MDNVFKTAEDLAIEEQVRKSKIQSDYVLGVDLGQMQDYTALCLIKKLGEGEPPYLEGSRFSIEGLERMPLGTSYPDIVAHVTKLLMMPELLTKPDLVGRNCVLVLDATGVGRPVFDLFKAAQLKPIGVTITSGNKVERTARDEYGVPRTDLISEAVVASQQGTLIAPPEDVMPLAAVLKQELRNINLKKNIATGRDAYVAWREGVHDDLVFAASLALFWIMHRPAPPRPAISRSGF